MSPLITLTQESTESMATLARTGQLSTDRIVSEKTRLLRHLRQADIDSLFLLLRFYMQSAHGSEFARALWRLNQDIFKFSLVRQIVEKPTVDLENLRVVVLFRGDNDIRLIDLTPPRLEAKPSKLYRGRDTAWGEVFKSSDDGVYATIPDPRPNRGELEWRFTKNRLPLREKGSDERVDVAVGNLLEVEYLYDSDDNLSSIGIVSVKPAEDVPEEVVPHATGLQDVEGRIQGERAWREKTQAARKRSGKRLESPA